MPGKGRVKVGIIGSRFEADFLAESFRIMPEGSFRRRSMRDTDLQQKGRR